MPEYKAQFIDFMQSCGVLTFGDFVAKSGRHTPYFINAGNYRSGAQLARLGEFYADAIADSGEQFDLLFGPAYKGIPLCTAASIALWHKYGRDVPYCFNRKEVKDHGEGGALVGRVPQQGERVAIIEDVTTAGTSVRETVELFRGTGARVSALFVSVDRMERGVGERSALAELRSELGIAIYAIVSIRDIINRLVEENKPTAAIQKYLNEWGGAL